ncbi:DUF4386 domain-containing protein [Chloroflexi bacterium TSY]|nr:DUF4386 domain-containing protein [Chloroflexi bacterium TSY]
MSTNRKIAMAVGALFLAGYVGVFGGGFLSEPILTAPDFPANIAASRSQLISGMLVELIVNDVAVLGIGVLMFQILRVHSEKIALGYLSIRIIEVATLVVSKFGILSLITLGQESVPTGALDAASFQVLGAAALAERHWIGQVNALFFILGALLLYYLLYQSKLVPRFLAAWGLFAVLTLALVNGMELFEVYDPSQGFQPVMLLYAPIFLSELLLGIWLIVKGFNPAAIEATTTESESGRIDMSGTMQPSTV